MGCQAAGTKCDMPGDPKHLTLFHGIYSVGAAVQALSGIIRHDTQWHTKGAQWHCILCALVGGTRTRRGGAQAASGSHAFIACRRGLRLQRRRLGRWVTTQSTESDSEDGSPWRCSGATESHAVTGRRATDPQVSRRPALPASSRLAASRRQAGQ